MDDSPKKLNQTKNHDQINKNPCIIVALKAGYIDFFYFFLIHFFCAWHYNTPVVVSDVLQFLRTVCIFLPVIATVQHLSSFVISHPVFPFWF